MKEKGYKRSLQNPNRHGHIYCRRNTAVKVGAVQHLAKCLPALGQCHRTGPAGAGAL